MSTDVPPELYTATRDMSCFVQKHLWGLGKLLEMALKHRAEERQKHGGPDHTPSLLCSACQAEVRALIVEKLGPEQLKSACCSLCLERLWAAAFAAP